MAPIYPYTISEWKFPGNFPEIVSRSLRLGAINIIPQRAGAALSAADAAILIIIIITITMRISFGGPSPFPLPRCKRGYRRKASIGLQGRLYTMLTLF